MKFYIDLDDCLEDLFHEMERIQDGGNGHTVMFKAEDYDDVDYSAGSR